MGDKAMEVRHPGGAGSTTDSLGMQDRLCCSGHHQLVSEFLRFCIHSSVVVTVYAQKLIMAEYQKILEVCLHAGTALLHTHHRKHAP